MKEEEGQVKMMIAHRTDDEIIVDRDACKAKHNSFPNSNFPIKICF